MYANTKPTVTEVSKTISRYNTSKQYKQYTVGHCYTSGFQGFVSWPSLTLVQRIFQAYKTVHPTLMVLFLCPTIKSAGILPFASHLLATLALDKLDLINVMGELLE